MDPDEGDGSISGGNHAFELDADIWEFLEQFAEGEVAFDLEFSDDTHTIRSHTHPSTKTVGVSPMAA
jgi:hypothetical protein